MPRAVFLVSPGKIEVRDVDKPTPGPTEVLIRVRAAALNPTDVKHIDNKYPVVQWGTISGCDFAGVIEEVGSSVPAELRTVGQRVAGAVHGASSHHSGGFADYVVTDPHLLVALPSNISFNDAAGIGLCGITAFQMLYQSQELSRPQLGGGHPHPTGKKILVWSGASAVGQLAIQIAASAGHEVITTASSRHSQHLHDLGASAVFDYSDLDVGEQIKKHTNGTLDSAVDCFSDGDSIKKIFDAIGPQGGIVSLVMPVKTEDLRQDVRVTRSVFYTTFSKATHSPYPGKAVPEHYVAAIEYYKTITQLIAEGRLKTSPIKLFRGLDGVQEGVDYLRSSKVSREKITFELL